MYVFFLLISVMETENNYIKQMNNFKTFCHKILYLNLIFHFKIRGNIGPKYIIAPKHEHDYVP